jgi:hypothetical protein
MKNEKNCTPVLCIIGHSVVKLELLPAASKYGVYGVVQTSERPRRYTNGKEKTPGETQPWRINER